MSGPTKHGEHLTFSGHKIFYNIVKSSVVKSAIVKSSVVKSAIVKSSVVKSAIMKSAAGLVLERKFKPSKYFIASKDCHMPLKSVVGHT